MRFLRALKNGPQASRELRVELDVSRMQVSNIARELNTLGLVERTEPLAKSPDQKYQLTTLGKRALRNERKLEERLQAAPAPKSRPRKS
jgi:DNA-binding HxlR family transcriptional regulator